MSTRTAEFWISIVLVIYLLLIGLGSAIEVAVNFPQESNGSITFPVGEDGQQQFVPFGSIGSVDQGLVLLAFFAGAAGAFLHAAQSLSSYVGNNAFRASWTAWYFLRPWIGGILGIAIYIVFRAGLIAGASAANPYGVAALGILGGWFSKTTTDKLQEVFETLFKTDEDKHRKDKLGGSD